MTRDHLVLGMVSLTTRWSSIEVCRTASSSNEDGGGGCTGADYQVGASGPLHAHHQDEVVARAIFKGTAVSVQIRWRVLSMAW